MDRRKKIINELKGEIDASLKEKKQSRLRDDKSLRIGLVLGVAVALMGAGLIYEGSTESNADLRPSIIVQPITSSQTPQKKQHDDFLNSWVYRD